MWWQPITSATCRWETAVEAPVDEDAPQAPDLGFDSDRRPAPGLRRSSQVSQQTRRLTPSGALRYLDQGWSTAERFVSKTNYNLYEAKTSLSKLVDRAAKGEEITLSKAGKPLAKLVSYRQPALPRQPGGWEERMRIADDFDAPLPPETQEAFEGGG